jgi:eukaryotic translation initiation factor 2C
LGDLVHAIPTQCVQLKRAQECKPQVLANICLKVNAKLNGTNFVISPEHRSWVLKEPVIFLGADVTHPAQGERDDRFPSIAAVVGSMDRHACKYAGRLSIQKHRQEIISDLTDMVKGLLEEFRVCTAKAPKRIIFYRDGVSEGQFQQVLVDELRAIQAACKLIHPDYQPGITIIIVQKRHHTRFFPINPEDKVSSLFVYLSVSARLTH